MKTKIKKRFNSDIIIDVDQNDNTKIIKDRKLLHFNIKGAKDLSKLVYVESDHLNCKLENLEIRVLENEMESGSRKYTSNSVSLLEIDIDGFDEESIHNKILIPITFVYTNGEVKSRRQPIILSIEYSVTKKKLMVKILKNYKTIRIDDDKEYIENRIFDTCINAFNDYFRNYGLFTTAINVGKQFFKNNKK